MTAQLAAGGKNVPAVTGSEDGRIMTVEQDLLKRGNRLGRRRPIVGAGKLVEGDKIQFAVEPSEKPRKLLRVRRGVVQAGHEDVFEGQHPSTRHGIVPAGLDQLFQRVFSIHGHQHIPPFVVRGVQRNGEVDADLVSQLHDLRDEPAG